MKRLAAIVFICAYLGALTWGTVAHAIKYKVGSHPAMYFVVWDMFCGWSAYSNRLQVIAEGESGKFYEVSPPPWGELNPFGHIERRHYDISDLLMTRMIANNLKHTSHEPISNVYVVEELWPKKFNLPDHVWEANFNEPKDMQKYYNIRGMFAADGTKTRCLRPWLQVQLVRSISNNPRLRKQAANSQPFFTVTPNMRSAAPKGN